MALAVNYLHVSVAVVRRLATIVMSAISLCFNSGPSNSDSQRLRDDSHATGWFQRQR